MNSPWTGFFRTGAVVLAVMLMAAGAAHADQRGKIEAVQRTIISSELSGRLDALPFRGGEAFKAGDTLVRLDCELYQAQRDQVSAKLKQARRTRDNKQRLAQLDSVGQLDVDLAVLAVEEARAALRIAALNAQRCTVAAPYPGRVVQLYARQDQSVKAQEKLLQIVGRELEARIIVPARWLSWLAAGQALELDVEETGQTVTARVSRIGAAVDPVSHTVPIWASLVAPGDTLRPGMSGGARFPERPDESRE